MNKNNVIALFPKDNKGDRYLKAIDNCLKATSETIALSIVAAATSFIEDDDANQFRDSLASWSNKQAERDEKRKGR